MRFSNDSLFISVFINNVLRDLDFSLVSNFALIYQSLLMDGVFELGTSKYAPYILLYNLTNNDSCA